MAKHARAARVIVSVTPENDRVRMTIEDDGEGFAPPPGSETPRKATWGLISMAERALALSGECRIESAPGEGTRVIIEVPQ